MKSNYDNRDVISLFSGAIGLDIGLTQAGLNIKIGQDFDTAYQRAANRLVKEFTTEFCLEDGNIDWEKLVMFNFGK